MQKKIARICWNSNNWTKPSGRVGKSQNKDLYENINGYGHEEWLLDISKVIDDFHYGYIQAIGQYRETYLGQTFDISIYSINSETKQYWWIGEIQNIKVVSSKESKGVYEKYKSKGWHKEMISQLHVAGVDADEFKTNVTPEAFVVVKFKPSALKLLDQPIKFSRNDPAVTSHYYNLKDKKLNPVLKRYNLFRFKAGHNEGKGTTNKTYRDYSSQVSLSHNALQTNLYKELIKTHGNKNVGTEMQCGSGSRIDIAVKKGKKFSLYEIKTSLTAKSCIREALGQLLEYAHFDDSIEIDKLVIASQNDIGKSEQEYLTKLSKLYNLPVQYKKIEQ